MSFPVTGSAADVAEWLQIEGFDKTIIDSFAKWNAMAMLGVTDIDLLLRIIPGNEGIRLWSLLNTARSLQSKFNHLIVS